VLGLALFHAQPLTASQVTVSSLLSMMACTGWATNNSGSSKASKEGDILVAGIKPPSVWVGIWVIADSS
jgi:hypothetical protein